MARIKNLLLKRRRQRPMPFWNQTSCVSKSAAFHLGLNQTPGEGSQPEPDETLPSPPWGRGWPRKAGPGEGVAPLPSTLYRLPCAVLIGAILIFLIVFAGACGTSSGAKLTAAAATTPASFAPPTVATVKIVSRRLNVTAQLPGELLPYEMVGIFPKVTGFVEWMGVDRGSRVKAGQLLVRLEAPELISRQAEAEATLQSAESRIDEAQAKLTADEATYERLGTAAQTPGVISKDELETAQKTAEADRARVVALRSTVEAAKETLKSLEEINSYLLVTAPFDGIITDRNVHPGALVGPAGGPGQVPMLRIQEMAHLRLVVDVPEAYVAGVREGTKVDFTVPAFPGRTFSGNVARISDRLHQATRTMPVELDVWNPSWTLDPGMFPTVLWPVQRPYPTLFVPQSSVARTMESTFVIRVHDGKAEWVNVTPGISEGNHVEIFGNLRTGDQVALHASEELQSGTEVTAHLVSPNP
jgi:membrane fusion protein, multidrug efflux system